MQNKVIIIFVFFILSSCFKSSRGLKYSYLDPFYLSKDQRLIKCDHASLAAFTPRTLIEFESFLDDLLDRYSNASGSKFNYFELRKNEEDIKALCGQLDRIAGAKLSAMGINERSAFLINVFTLLTIHLIVQHYGEVQIPGRERKPEFRSIQNIFQMGPRIWTGLKWHIAGAYRSLDEIENTLLYPLLGAKVHFLMQRPAVGFEVNYKTAFTGQNIRERLEERASSFVNEVSFFDDGEANDKVIFVSELIERNAGHFVGVRDFFAEFLDSDRIGVDITKDDLFLKILDPNNRQQTRYLWRIEYEPFNWSINEVSE